MAKTRYEPPRTGFTVEGPSLRAEGDYIGKVSGTMVGAIKGVSPFASPFSVACELLGLGVRDISDLPAVKTGKVLEERIIEYLDSNYKQVGTFLSSEEMFDPRLGAHADWKPDFDDEVFTGHIDGAVLKDDGSAYILEVKTTSYIQAWADGVPIYYYYQVALYNHFLAHQDKAYVVLGIVDDATHKDPDSWVPSEENVILMEVNIDKEEMEKVMEEVRTWYEALKESRLTPMYDPNLTCDAPLYSHLATLATDEHSIKAIIDEAAELEERIRAVSAEVEALNRQKDTLRASLKDYMENHDSRALDSLSGRYTAVLGTQTRTRISPERLKADGIDPSKYMEETTVNTFTIKKNEE